MRENRHIYIISLSIVLLILNTPYAFASSDHEESIAIQKACGLSGVPCSNNDFESKQIERFFTKVNRKNEDLNMKTISESSIILSNKKVNQESRKVHWFLTYFQQIKYYLVQVRGWEGTGYLMINASTGNINSFFGVPIISKDIKRFVVASLDLEAGYLPNRISIFRLIDNKIEKEWSKDYPTSGPSDATWINNTVITFFENSSKNGGQTIDKKLVTIVLINDEWKIVSGEN
jgi:hypothetical protein